jgi:hypothetical protein
MNSGGGKMSKQRNIEAMFSENLDRILAGEEIDLNALGDVEMRSALEFSRRMSRLVPAPSAQFSTRLKAGLQQKLDEREARAEEKRGWSWNFLRRPAWQAVIAVLAVILIVSIVWRSGVFRPSIEAPKPSVTTTTTVVPTTTAPTTGAPAPSTTATTTPSATTAPGALLSVSAMTGKSTYQAGEQVGINVSMGNSSSQKLTLANLPPILSIMSAATEKPVYTFSAGKETLTLGPGDTLRFNYTWDGLDFNGVRVTGLYYVELEDLEYQGIQVPLHLGQPAYFEVLPASGPQAGDTQYQETQTYNNISVTINEVNISEAGIIVSAFITKPPDYVVTQGSNGYIASKNYSAPAAYSFDGGWIQDIDGSSVIYLKDGMNHTWFIPDIIPPEAKELFFHVTSIGDWQGSWQFHIPLK